MVACACTMCVSSGRVLGCGHQPSSGSMKGSCLRRGEGRNGGTAHQISSSALILVTVLSLGRHTMTIATLVEELSHSFGGLVHYHHAGDHGGEVAETDIPSSRQKAEKHWGWHRFLKPESPLQAMHLFLQGNTNQSPNSPPTND